MYLISKSEELTTQRLKRILDKYQTTDLPKLQKYLDYYKGKQEIIYKKATDTGKPCNKIVANYCYSIVNNYLGYMAGIPVKYNNDGFEEILDILNYNDVHNEDEELLRLALIFGVSFEINYIDEEGKLRFRVLDSRECIPLYDNTLTNELLYVIRFYKEEMVQDDAEYYIVEVYGPADKKIYRSTPGFNSFELVSQEPNFYNQCPVTVFSLNVEECSIFDRVMSLQDGYNRLLSDEVDDFDSFADAYLILKGAIADKDDFESMKKNRILMLDNDADANYLTKSISDTQIENMLKNFNDHIHTIANCPDFTDKDFMSQSGVAIRYKLVGFENTAASIESNMRKALQKRIELICSILSLTGDETIWRDVEITFTRNLPLSLEPSNPNELMAYKGLVSDRTLLEQIPFVKDVDKEEQLIKKQTEENMALYQFQNEVNQEDEQQ